METRIIFDLASCFAGGEAEAIEVTRRYAASQAVPDEHLHVVLRPDQQAVPEIPASWRRELSERIGVPYVARRMVEGMLSPTNPIRIHVMSFNSVVLRPLQQFRYGGVEVQTVHLGALRHIFQDRSLRIADGEPRWAFDQVAPLEDAIRVLQKVLEGRGATSRASAPRVTDIRPAMAFVDGRFAGKGLLTGTSGMMTMLVQIAERRGIVEVDRQSTMGNFFVWLRSSASASVVKPAAPVSPAVSLDPRADDRVAAAESLGEPSVASESVDQAPSRDIEYRSRVLEGHLKASGYGPYAIGREAIWRFLPDAMSRSAGATLDQVISAAAKEARSNVKEKYPDKEQPWSRIQAFVRKLLTESRSVLDPTGVALQVGWRSGGSQVGQLTDDWLVRVDACLVVVLVDREDLSDDDEQDLAGALFHDRQGDQAADRVKRAVGFLLDSGTISEILVDGRWHLRRSSIAPESQTSISLV
jgi:hypothetical protein